MNKIAVIVAGGSGKRMQNKIPKQFLLLCGKPILMQTINRFFQYDNKIEIIVVLPENQFDRWRDLCLKFNFIIKHRLVVGGAERFFSVKNALSNIENEGLVAIHDGVRPLVNDETIKNCFEKAEKTSCAVPVVDIKESIRFVENNNNISVNRAKYKIVQTPQVFDVMSLKEAYSQTFNSSFTDDASVFEAMGNSISIVHGNVENIKITDSFDLRIAEILMKILSY